MPSTLSVLKWTFQMMSRERMSQENLQGIMNLPLFEPTLVNQRWTMAYYEEMAETRFSCDDSTLLDQSLTTVTLTENKQIVLSQAQKFRTALRIAQSLASLASEGGMCTLTTRLRQMEDAAEYWSLGREVTISAQRDSPLESRILKTRKVEGKWKNN